MRAEVEINGRKNAIKLDENAVLVAIQFNDGVHSVQIHGNGFLTDIKPSMTISQYDLSENGYSLKLTCLNSADSSIVYDAVFSGLCVYEYHAKGIDILVFN